MSNSTDLEAVRIKMGGVSEAFMRANGGAPIKPSGVAKAAASKSPIRQKRGPKMNKLETAFFGELEMRYGEGKILAQKISLEIGNGCKYTPDMAFVDRMHEAPFAITFWEVKGPHAWDDSICKLKVAASAYPYFEFWLVRRGSRFGPWEEHRVFP